jgi:hypothetical protein
MSRRQRAFQLEEIPREPRHAMRTVVQLNVVHVVDVDKALHAGKLEDSLYSVDNNPGSANRGTSELVTQCIPGQVINWILYPMNDYTAVRIHRIEFFAGPILKKLQVFGNFYRSGSPWPGTPTYDYWAGIVGPKTAPGQYFYKLDLQLYRGLETRILRLDTCSLDVVKPARKKLT